MEVCLGFLVERDVVVQPRDSGGEIDESPEEDTTRGDDLACKGELADEREQGSFGAGVPLDEVMERLEQFLVWEMEPVIATESSSIPRKVSVVAGPSVFSCLRGALTLAQRSVMRVMFCWQAVEYGGPAVKKSSK